MEGINALILQHLPSPHCLFCASFYASPPPLIGYFSLSIVLPFFTFIQLLKVIALRPPQRVLLWILLLILLLWILLILLLCLLPLIFITSRAKSRWSWPWAHSVYWFWCFSHATLVHCYPLHDRHWLAKLTFITSEYFWANYRSFLASSNHMSPISLRGWRSSQMTIGCWRSLRCFSTLRIFFFFLPYSLLVVSIISRHSIGWSNVIRLTWWL